ncbi:MAG: hypothetical protein AAFX96_08365, partial [Pseudomonadota bacterium]
MYIRPAVRNQRPVLARIFGSGLLDGYTLHRYSSWFRKERPTASWASRYLGDIHWDRSGVGLDKEPDSRDKFSSIKNLLTRSQWRRGIRIGAMFTLVFVGVGWLINQQRLEAVQARQEAEEAQVKAQQAERKAEEANRDKEVAIEQREKLELEFKEAIDRVILGTADSIERSSPEGESLYVPQSTASEICDDPNSFCARLKSRSKAEYDAAELRSLVSKPLCSGNKYATDISKLGSDVRPFCTFHPPRLLADTTLNYSVSDVDQNIYKSTKNSLLSPTEATKERERSIFFGLAGKYNGDAQFFGSLSAGYLFDRAIPEGRRFSEANACMARSIQLLCAPHYNARRLFLQMSGYENNILSNIPAGDGRVTLKKDITTLKIMMAAELLDAPTLTDDVDISSASTERVSRLWRGFDGASDAARFLYQNYGCADLTVSIEQCEIADELYAKAATALYVLIDHSKQTY